MSKSSWRVNTALATSLGVGFFPFAPGTVGTAFAVALALALPPLLFTWPWAIPFLAVLFLLGVPVCGAAERTLGHDSGHIVLDEVVGMFCAMAMLPRVWPVIAAAFALFRLFDILKPFGIRGLQKLPGGWGVMADDLAAGLLANLIIQVVLLFL